MGRTYAGAQARGNGSSPQLLEGSAVAGHGGVTESVVAGEHATSAEENPAVCGAFIKLLGQDSNLQPSG
jgi:hypothetical protein